MPEVYRHCQDDVKKLSHVKVSAITIPPFRSLPRVMLYPKPISALSH